MSKLTKDLNTVAGIVGELGLNIAEAQKRFDLNYLENIEKLLGIAKLLAENTSPAPDALEGAIKQVLLSLAPSRYQFTETTLSVRLNLAQSFDLGTSVGGSAGFGAFAVNAALTVGYSFNYEAAAECRTVIHAIPPDSKTFTDLLGRAKAIGDTALTVPARTEVDTKIHDRLEAIYGKLPDIKLVADGAKKKLTDAA